MAYDETTPFIDGPWYLDLNSKWYLMIRWILLLNQLLWTFVLAGAWQHNQKLSLVSYTLATGPIAVIILLEMLIVFFCGRIPDLRLNSKEWMIYRLVILLLIFLLGVLWLEIHVSALLVTIWIILTVTMIIEIIVGKYCRRDIEPEVPV